ncbi:M1 family metallopeptidase [uncultured Thermanaerothrix sp.]|uniref:M1 family metallopeptidase n=1 Tax=uncultured Thermanaerothrix sp. TaxID=1195149 RepID=UPI00262256EB|nr:M1 family metallopeptidase [uncultured Thermanaerothrix sp.]
MIKKQFGRAILRCVLGIGLGLGLVACRPVKDTWPSLPSPTDQDVVVPTLPLSTPIPTPTAEVTETSAPTSTTLNTNESGLTRYRLRLQLNPETHTAEVRATINWFNDTGKTQTDLPLIIEPARYPNVFTLLEVFQNDQLVTLIPETANMWRLQGMAPVTAGSTSEFTITFRLDLPEIPPPSDTTKPQIFGFTRRQVNLVDWYPFIPPFRDGKWLVHPPGYFGEHLVYPLADFEVTLRLEGTNREWQVAASAPAERALDGSFHFDYPRARNFVLSLSPDYRLQEQTINGVQVRGFVFAESEQAGQAALDATTRALDLYSRWFLPYSRAQLSLVEADFLDGMEYDGLYFLSKGFYNLYDGTPQGYLTMIAAHETAHQWWYVRVANDQAMHPWLDEALCTYSERLFYETYYPELVSWWWFYRVNYYQPAGWIDKSIYDYAGYQSYRNAVYLRGAQFFEDVRRTMGDKAFLTALGDYVQRYDGKIANSHDLLDVLVAHSPNDLEPVFRQYLSDYLSR